jgi:hypothetical protein
VSDTQQYEDTISLRSPWTFCLIQVVARSSGDLTQASLPALISAMRKPELGISNRARWEDLRCSPERSCFFRQPEFVACLETWLHALSLASGRRERVRLKATCRAMMFEP